MGPGGFGLAAVSALSAALATLVGTTPAVTAAVATSAVPATSASNPAPVPTPTARSTAGGLPAICSAPQGKPTVEGHPHVVSVPQLASVSIRARQGGLDVTYGLRSRLVQAPEGVYISWTVFIYRTRADVNDARKLLALQFEDRGPGWEPTGWVILVSAYENNSPVVGHVFTNAAVNRLSVYFPPGFVNLRPPFYWFASQEEYRAYLPGKHGARIWAVNGGVFSDCPAGVRPDPNSFPYPARLLPGPPP